MKAETERASPWKAVKRGLFLCHRWLGVATCLLSVMWLLSGLVMLYVPFPSWSEEERLAHLPAIDGSRVTVMPDAAMTGTAEGVRLEMLADEPVYRVTHGGALAMISAATGDPIEIVGPERAKAHVEALFPGMHAGPAEVVERDQWTVTRRFDPHRPLYRIGLDDAAQTVLYVSSKTGELVQHTTRLERFWNWLGAIPHWIYFTPIRKDQELWRQVVMWTSAPLIIGAAIGLWLGSQRLRLRRRYSGGRASPYRGWKKLHHVGGLLGGVFLVTWISSGWLSVNPFNVLPRPQITDAQRTALAGLAPGPEPRVTSEALAAAIDHGAREITTSAFGGLRLLIVRDGAASRLLDATTGAALTLEETHIRRAVSAMLPSARLTSLTRLETADVYWVSRMGHKPLPVLRAVFDDPAVTWIYIDPKTGSIAGVSDRFARTERWLFRFAHTYDLPLLIENGPARDIVIWVFSLAGLVVAVSGTTLAIGSLKRSLKRSRDRSRSAPATTAAPPQSAARAH